MPIFRMPVVLHANYPHANCPHANSPNANCPSSLKTHKNLVSKTSNRMTYLSK